MEFLVSVDAFISPIGLVLDQRDFLGWLSPGLNFQFSSMAFARVEYSFCLKSLDYLLSKKAFQFVLNRREHDLAEAHLFLIG